MLGRLMEVNSISGDLVDVFLLGELLVLWWIRLFRLE